jgi:hypothetical protein
LVELSVVLVILGLLVGGVLSGQLLIRSAQIRSIMTEQSAYVVAVQTFKGKYLMLPGDMNNATSFWPTGGGDNLMAGTCQNGVRTSGYPGAGTKVCNGNGDGVIGAASNSVAMASGFLSLVPVMGDFEESFMAWSQMALAGIVPGQYMGTMAPPMPPGTPASKMISGSGACISVGVNTPAAKSFSNAGWMLTNLCFPSSDPNVFPGICSNVLAFGGGAPQAYDNYLDWPAYPVISPVEAANIDQKMDDGKPATGTVMTYPAGFGRSPNCATTAVVSTAQYATTLSNNECALIFIPRF